MYDGQCIAHDTRRRYILLRTVWIGDHDARRRRDARNNHARRTNAAATTWATNATVTRMAATAMATNNPKPSNANSATVAASNLNDLAATRSSSAASSCISWTILGMGTTVAETHSCASRLEGDIPCWVVNTGDGTMQLTRTVAQHIGRVRSCTVI